MARFPGSWLFTEATDWRVDERTHSLYTHGLSPSLYQTLDGARTEIRLLHIAPNADRKAPLSCKLKTTSLTDHLAFQSLSYAWGKGNSITTLRVEDSELDITSNLHAALCAVRKPDQALLLWVDAICINQHDLEERNHQVKLMRQIYTQASMVNIWLGDETLGSPIALGLLNKVAQGLTLYSMLSNLNSLGQHQRITELKSIFEYPWWQRLWVIQEALLAKHAIVYCGRNQVDFAAIMQAFEAIWNEYIRSGQLLRSICGPDSIEPLIRQLELTIRRLHIIQSFVFYYKAGGTKRHFRDAPATLPFLLHTCAWSQASDPRDKIYGALGLFSTPFLEPDYSLSVEQVYTRSAAEIMQYMGNLALVSQARPGDRAELLLPSWVPDWTRPSALSAPYLVFYSLYNAAKGRPFHVRLLDDHLLEVTAKIVDEVVEVSEEYNHRDCSQASDLPPILGPIIAAWKAMHARYLQAKANNRMPPRVDSMDPSEEVHAHNRTIAHTAYTSALSAVGTTVRFNPYSPQMMQNNTPSHTDAYDRGLAMAPMQSQVAPLYRDTDYSTPHSGLRQHQHPARGHTAPFYRDADYTRPRSRLGQDKHLAPDHAPALRYDVGYPQSACAPLYHDADYSGGLNGVDKDHLNHGRPDPITKPLSIPYNPNAADATQATYRVYNSYTHTYVPASSQHPDVTPWKDPALPDQLLVFLSGKELSWALIMAVKRQGFTWMTIGRRAQTDMASLLRELYDSMLAGDDSSLPDERLKRAFDHRFQCIRLERLLCSEITDMTRLSAHAQDLPFPPPSRRPSPAPGHYDASENSDFWRTLTADVIDCSHQAKRRRCSPVDEDRVMEWLEWILSTSKASPTSAEKEWPPQLVHIHWHLNTLLQKKRMILTRGGRLALVGEGATVGDKVALLGGENYCYLLRSAQTKTNPSEISNECKEMYALVGPAYVHGLMDGEAVADGVKKEETWNTVFIV